MNTNFPVVRLMKGIMLKYMPGMITCVDFEQFIDDYLDQSLSPAEVTVFERHIKLCRECREYLAAYKRTIELGKESLTSDQSEAPTIDDIPADLIAAIKAAKSQKNI